MSSLAILISLPTIYNFQTAVTELIFVANAYFTARQFTKKMCRFLVKQDLTLFVVFIFFWTNSGGFLGHFSERPISDKSLCI